jgi:hypothetical protein
MIYNCRFFCFLASEMAYQARKKSEQYKSDPENHTPLNEYRYCVATVIIALTHAATYVNHLVHPPDSPVAGLFGEMSPNLRGRIDRLSFKPRL